MRRISVILSTLLLLCSCGAQKLPTVTLDINGISVQAELALTPETRETGLMYRKTLAEGSGMLFVFTSDQKLNFWMKNTEVPLSIAYIGSDGTILELYDMKPFSLASVPGQHNARYALEVPRGWFMKIGAQPGDRVTIPPLPAAR